MAQLATKFIADNAVSELKARLSNNSYLRGRNAANSSDINMIRVNASNLIEFPSVPQIASGTPSAAADMVNVAYVSSAIANLPVKAPAQLVSTSNLTLSGEQTIDGVLTSASRILVAGQTTASANGIYVTGSGAWSRASDFSSAAAVYAGVSLFITAGTANGDSYWELTTDGAITVGTTALAFSKMAPSASITVPVPQKDSFTLISGDITNQYVDLSQIAKASSIDIVVSGIVQREGTDYTVNLTGGAGGKTRITFAGDLATAGGAALVVGDIVIAKYQY